MGRLRHRLRGQPHHRLGRTATTHQHHARSGPSTVTSSRGVDFRLTKIFGIGPFVDFSFGKYTNETIEPRAPAGDDIANKAMHEWLTLGAKFLFFP